MDKKLPARPNLDHLRRQAKALLADLAAGQAAAAATFREHLPAAKGLDAAQLKAAPFGLADAQAAVARQSGFAGWPHLARHVAQLRALEGTWVFERLETDGVALPAAMLGTSRVLIDGDRFRTETPEAIYEGVFNIDVEMDPAAIDIEFVAGPEAGNWNHGIFRVDGDRLEICLDLNGKARPGEFKTAAGRGHAWEVLRRASSARPPEVKGGVAPAAVSSASPADRAAFDYVPSPLLTQLQGEWSAVEVVRDGQPLPWLMLKMGKRSAKRNEVHIAFAGQTVIHALVKLDPSRDPVAIDYYNLDGMAKDTLQEGILRWIDGDACFCMAAPGQPRPADFTSTPGSGRTYSRWKSKKRT
ncbi:MAG TPA: TIGR03067 domain-containing protein [Opitutaceae bacterium]|nr:TIGR03067 domain-containing protein [Opitutaceae bacterium]